MQLQKMPKHCQFTIQIFVDCIEAFLQLFLCQLAHGVVGWVVVYVGEENGLREGGLDVFARTSVTMSASTNLIAKTISITWALAMNTDTYFVVK